MSFYQGKYYLFANWKMYLDYNEANILANALASEVKKFPPYLQMTVFPSALSFYPVAQVLHDVNIGVGAQNAFWVDKGGYTGEISMNMYKDAGCQYVLIGHSERRHQFGETNHDIRAKMEAALAVGLTPVLCVGETATERDRGQTTEVLEIQLRAALNGLEISVNQELIIAYEPVWAIGGNTACVPVEADKLHLLIKKLIAGLVPRLTPVILYGGSVRAENVRDYLKQENIHGVLVGGAAVKLNSWLDIIHQARF